MNTVSKTVSALAATSLLLLSGSTSAQSTCNGHAELCSRQYSNVSYIGAHNSYSVQAGSIASNQNYDVTAQLDNGIRMLQNQAHTQDNEVHLCHSSCLLLDAGPLTDYLGKVRSWLDENPNEVITILWINSDSIPVASFGAAYQAVGLDQMAYVPTSTPVAYNAWPTLQELISSGKRVVSFMDYNADYSSVNYILDHFTHFWENPYSQTDASFPCNVDRGSADTQMYMMNHYLDKNLTFFGSQIPIPDTGSLETTNAVSGSSSLGQNAAECAAQHGQYPTYLLVDFYDVKDGSVFEVAANLNGVQYTPIAMGNGTAVASPGSSSSSSSGSGSRSSSSISSQRTGSVSSTNNNTGAAVAGMKVSSLASAVAGLSVLAASIAVLA
ncbi:PLC-like phosphodiesterase [Cystobasidium minutum MCA 4210]|uniref:PLC-like phosphodiesterase n=1 Tax=Cystobasidium minutum MCA 4210 TaxID=1397322 RepID=UPI0034CF2DFB|eukprot:jgi/Rhomi1/209716/estExt_Genemark1.C_3_t10363